MKAILFLLTFVPIFTLAQNQLILKGKIKGLQNGTPVFMTDVNRPTDTLAHALVSGESFTLRAALKEPMPVNLVFGNTGSQMTFLGNTVTKVTGNIADLSNLKYAGSPTANDFRAFEQTFNPLFGRLNTTGQLMQSSNGNDSVMQMLNRQKDTIMQKVDEFVHKRRSSPVSAFLVMITMQLDNDITKTEQRYLRLKQPALKNMYGEYLTNIITETKVTAIGSVAQDFTQTDTAGVNVSLSSFRGKYVLLDFWASWCGPCRQENPNVVANFKKFNAKNFTVLGVSLDRPGQKDKWIQAIHKDNLTWTHVSDLQFWENAVAKQYRVQSIPQNLLIGPDGKIIAKDLRGPALEAKLCEIFGCQEQKAF